MTLEESSIFVNLKRLRNEMFRAQFDMEKGNRIIYGTPLMQNIGKALSYFVLAFTVKGKRLEYLHECIGHFTVFRIDLEFCVYENIIHFKKRKKGSDGKDIPPEDKKGQVSTREIEIFSLVGKIDGDMCRWLKSLEKT